MAPRVGSRKGRGGKKKNKVDPPPESPKGSPEKTVPPETIPPERVPPETETVRPETVPVPETAIVLFEQDSYDKTQEEHEKEEHEREEHEEKGDPNEKTDSEATNTDDETEAMLPLEMHFPNTEYTKKVKITTRCYHYKAVADLEQILDAEELRWFTDHPQFSHFFHMHRDSNHKSMGMWMLLLRTASIEKKKEAWFLVNGVPVRYSLREHALISGLDCNDYPENYKKLGDRKFVDKIFKKKRPCYEEIRDKFLSMTAPLPGTQRLQVAVLYFLASVIKGNAKQGEGALEVDPLFLNYVSDLELCKTFPWGRFSFEDTLKEIKHTMDNCDGVAKPPCIPSFIIPLELLPFEAIPQLNKTFREVFVGASSSCPRMCKSKFKRGCMKGFSIAQINEALGETKDIHSIMEPNLEELPLVMQNTKPEEDDCCDPVVDGWMKLLKRGKKICFEEVFKKDVEGRAKKNSEEKEGKKKGKGKAKKKESQGSSDDLKGLKESMEAGFKFLGEMIGDTNNNLGARLSVLEAFVEAQKKGKAEKKGKKAVENESESEDEEKETEDEEKEVADDESEAEDGDEENEGEHEEKEAADDESEAEDGEKEAAEDESEAEDGEKEAAEDEKEAEFEGSEAEKDERKAGDADGAGVHRKRPLSPYRKPITRGAKKGRKN